MELVDASLKKDTSMMQCEVIFSHSVKLTGKLLKLQDQVTQLRPCLSNFQLQLSKSIAQTLQSTEDVEVKCTINSINCIVVMS